VLGKPAAKVADLQIMSRALVAMTSTVLISVQATAITTTKRANILKRSEDEAASGWTSKEERVRCRG